MEIRSKLKLSAFLILSVLFLSTSSSWANAHHGHRQHANGVSPFNQNKRISLHCILKGHSINDLCPHLIKASKDKSLPCVISSSCGSHPYQKESTSGGLSLQFIHNAWFQTPHYESSQSLYFDRPTLSLSNNDSVDPPPKLS